MSQCKYCGAEILWHVGRNGHARPDNPDGTPHHRTCRAYHAIEKAERARKAEEAALAAAAANPSQMQFAFPEA